jgi:formate hydrogenlyase subunit 3/multisubunit Na+/H+ antiporter MnhD subunit
MLKVLIEVIGWTAAAMMLAAYFLLTSGKLSPRSAAYQWLNLCSGAGIVVNSGWNGAYPSATINVVWMAISLYGLARITRAS